MMDPYDLVHAVMQGDDLAARQWVKDAKHAGVDFSAIPDPGFLGDERVVAAAVFELLAHRQGNPPPSWTRNVGAAKSPIFLLSSSAAASPAMRRMLMRGTPSTMRRRNVFAVRDYLDVI